MKIARPCHALLAICSPQLGPTSWASIFSGFTFSSSASSSLTWVEVLVSTVAICTRLPPSPSSWTMAVCPETRSAASVVCCTEAEVLGVVKTAPPSNSIPMFRPRTTTPTMAVMVIRIERPYQSLRCPTKS